MDALISPRRRTLLVGALGSAALAACQRPSIEGGERPQDRTDHVLRHGKCDTVAELPADVAKQAEEGGLVDTNKAAVAACAAAAAPAEQ